jgi:ATP-binding cassette subfamily F protein uup
MSSRRERDAQTARVGATADERQAESAQVPRPGAGSAEERAARKTLARIDKQLARLAEQEKALDTEIAAHAHDHERLTELSSEYAVVRAERETLEQEWLEAAEMLE